MKYFSTFSGIGGFELGIHNAFASTRILQRVNDSTSPTSNLAGELSEQPLCVGYSEINKYAIKVYEKQFKGAANYGDITKINAKELPDFDCLVGGFPCQSFSIAGKRGGFSDTRGTLFFDLARILRAKKPRLFVFENVKGLLSHDEGRTFATIINAIDELGYDCQWQVLNSKNFGVPQNRERVIIVGHLRGEPRPEIFPLIGANGKALEVAGYLNTPTWQKRNESIRRVYRPEGIGPTLPTGTGGGHLPKIIGTINLGKFKETGGRALTITANYFKGPDNHGQRPMVKETEPEPRIRRLTPLECERLQGFPDNWTKYGSDEVIHWGNTPVAKRPERISDTQRYKMCGNAVTTNVIQAVFERIFAEKEN